MYNEEKSIRLKLENLCNVIYPEEKMQVILANDASTDRTLEEVTKFVNDYPMLSLEMINETKRRGKTKALNLALEHAENDIIVMTDADTFWAPDILSRTLPYLADPSVGAVVGRPKTLNRERSLVVETEKMYLDLVSEIFRHGESKIHSTFFIHGAFAAYKKEFLKEFNAYVDDSGTALDVIQRGGRTLFIPEGYCFVVSPITWKGRTQIKLRRAAQLVQLCAKCLNLLVNGRLSLPKKIAVPEIFLYLFNPIIFLLSVFTTFAVMVEYFPYSIFLPLFLLPMILTPKGRLLLIEGLQTNCILCAALLQSMLGRKFITWNTQEETRLFLTREMLEREELI